MAGDDRRCYVCLEGGDLVRKTCTCRMWVHSECLRAEIAAMPATVCPTCKGTYATELNVKFDFSLILWIAMLALLLLDEALIIASTHMPWHVGLWFFVVDLMYGCYLGQYVASRHCTVLVERT